MTLSREPVLGLFSSCCGEVKLFWCQFHLNGRRFPFLAFSGSVRAAVCCFLS